jgi:hypothetical protein
MTDGITEQAAQQMDEVTHDFVFVADAAQAVAGKLYVVGGGWTHLWLPEFPGRAPIPFFVAIGLRIPWNRTNQRFTFSLEVRDSDEALIGGEPAAHGDFEQGRPPGLTPGTEQPLMMAVPIGVEFPEPGRYVFVVLVNDTEVGRTAIEVRPVPTTQ